MRGRRRVRCVYPVQRATMVRVPTSDADTQRHQHDDAGGRGHLARHRPHLPARLLLLALSASHVHRAARRPVDHQRQPRSGRATVTCRPEANEREAVSRKQRYADARLRCGRIHRLSGASVCPSIPLAHTVLSVFLFHRTTLRKPHTHVKTASQ